MPIWTGRSPGDDRTSMRFPGRMASVRGPPESCERRPCGHPEPGDNAEDSQQHPRPSCRTGHATGATRRPSGISGDPVTDIPTPPPTLERAPDNPAPIAASRFLRNHAYLSRNPAVIQTHGSTIDTDASMEPPADASYPLSSRVRIMTFRRVPAGFTNRKPASSKAGTSPMKR